MRTSVLLLAVLLTATPLVARVAGRVVDRASGDPMAAVRVTVQASQVFVQTGVDGRFELDAPVGQWVVVAAARKGYYNGSTTIVAPAEDLMIALDAVPAMNNPDYVPMKPSECGECHPAQLEEWTGSPMSQTGQNAWVYDIYSGSGTSGGNGGFVYQRDSDFAVNNPSSECAACHQPEAWIQQPHTALAPRDDPTPASMHGISCDVCHKIAHIDESRKSYPGVYQGIVTVSRPYGDQHQVQYGVLGDGIYGLYPSRMRSSYQPQLVAAMCGACHQDKNDPDADGDFDEDNGIIAEPTYLDWLNSAYGDPSSPHFATCVECHMPPSGETRVCSFQDFVPPQRDPATIRSHRIEGTTPRFLENAVSLELDGRFQGDELVVEASVLNDRTGHYLPGGIAIRNIVLLVEAYDADGNRLEHTGTQTIHELGGIGDPDQGYYSGLPGKLFAQVRHSASGTAPVFFTEATGVVFDTRIAPLAADVTDYRFAVPPAADEVSVRARLIYRRAYRQLVDEKGWTQDGHGRPLVDLASPHYGHLMEEAQWSSRLGASSGDHNPQATLYQSFPNPLNASATIGFDMRRHGRVRLGIYDSLGREVRRLVDEERPAGYHTVSWGGVDNDGHSAATGVYISRLQVGTEVYTERLLLLR